MTRPGPVAVVNLANLVDAFFGEFRFLLQPGHHPKWHEVDIMADLPGWQRFPPAAQWLQQALR
jgi:hypothetical protein